MRSSIFRHLTFLLSITALLVACSTDEPDNSSDPALLEDLIPSQGQLEPAFDPNLTNYLLPLNYDMTTISFMPITPFPWDVTINDASSLTPGEFSPNTFVEEGDTIFNIRVEGAAKTTQTYRITVQRRFEPFIVQDNPLLIILVDFTDTSMPGSIYANETAEESWGSLMFGTEQGQGNHYWSEVSDGLFSTTPAFETYGVENNGVVHVELTENVPTSGQYRIEDQTWIPDALTLASNYVEFESFDLDGDHQLDNQELSVLFVLNIPYPRILGAGAQANIPIYHTVDGVVLQKFARTQFDYTSIGVNVHELGHHILGLSHLMAPNGGYSLMDRGAYNEDPIITTFHRANYHWGTRPSHMTAYSKVKAQFETPILIDDTTYGVKLHKSTSDQYNVIKVPTLNAFLYLENRQPDGYESSVSFCNQLGGIFAQEVMVTESALRLVFETEDYELCDFECYAGHNDSFRIGGFLFTNVSISDDIMSLDIINEYTIPVLETYFYKYWIPDPNRPGYRIWKYTHTLVGETVSIDYQSIEPSSSRLSLYGVYNTDEIRSLASATWTTTSKYLVLTPIQMNYDVDRKVFTKLTVRLSVDNIQPYEEGADITIDHEGNKFYLRITNIP